MAFNLQEKKKTAFKNSCRSNTKGSCLQHVNMNINTAKSQEEMA